MPRPNPFTHSHVLPALFFSWVDALLKRKGEFTEADLWEVSPGDAAEGLYASLDAAWTAERARGVPVLHRALITAFGFNYLILAVPLLLKAACVLASTQFLGLLLDELRSSSTNPGAAYAYAAGLVAMGAAGSVGHHMFFFHAWRSGMRWRCALVGLVYNKCLSLRLDALARVSGGHIITLVATDCERFQKACQYLHYIIVAPVETGVCVWLLYREVKEAAFVGLAAMALLVAAQAYLSHLYGKLRTSMSSITDERVRVTGQVISGARVLKMQAWEPSFAANVERVRAEEMAKLRSAAVWRGITEGLYIAAPLIVGAATYLPYYGLGYTLTPRAVFTTVALYQFLQVEAGKFFQMAVESIVECNVGLRRLQAFLLLPEVRQLQDADDAGEAGDGKDIIRVSNLTCRWQQPLDDHYTPAAASRPWLSLRSLPLPVSVRALPTSALSATPAAAMHDADTLTGINLSVARGQLCAIVGTTGSGKTSLLNALISELVARKGDAHVTGRVAFVSQVPWIMSATVRENITFGLPFDADRYARVLDACCLQRDLALLSHGDETQIGERGVNLSGGQRARISLARACFMDADVYLLDDPLSAVDARVGRLLFESCISGLLHDKTRVLVTHQLQCLKACDTIVVLSQGRVLTQGTFGELSSLMSATTAGDTSNAAVGATLTELLREFAEEEQEEEVEKEEVGEHAVPVTSSSVEKAPPPPSGCADDQQPTASTSTPPLAPDAVIVRVPSSIQATESARRRRNREREREDVAATTGAAKPSSIIVTEQLVSGATGWSVYIHYWRASGNALSITCIMLLMAGGNTLMMMTSVVLANWGNSSASVQKEPGFPILYGSLVAASFVVSIVRAVTFLVACLNAASALHNEAFNRVLRAPTSFFDSNPAGRILSRLSKDVGVLDDLLPLTYFDFLGSLFMNLAALALICAVNPWLLLAVPIIGIVFLRTRAYYMSSARTLKRIEAISRSPVFALLNEALGGVAIIRAFHLQSVLARRYQAALDANTRAYFAWLAASRWFGVRLDAICVLLLTAAAFACVAARASLSPSLVGLSLSQILVLIGWLQWTVRQAAETENCMVSAERLMEYCALHIEEVDIDARVGAARTVAAAAALPPAWPMHGDVRFKDVCMRYRPELPHVLRGVTFHAAPGMKVGIVGRTGAGKSSIFVALLRLVEPDRMGSSDPVPACGISIDGVDIARLHLSDLRRACSVIPQDPVLFSGSMRSNLDPFNQHSDSDCERALERVQLLPFVRAAGGLSMPVAENGSSLSVGQRQLVCLARAILRNTKVLLMDECTASVDADTDVAIQIAIRTAFRDATVITIAHRLATIIDCDRVVMLENGLVLECAHPHTLLRGAAAGSAQSQFAALVAETGDKTAAILSRDAEAAYATTRFRDGADMLQQ